MTLIQLQINIQHIIQHIFLYLYFKNENGGSQEIM